MKQSMNKAFRNIFLIISFGFVAAFINLIASLCSFGEIDQKITKIHIESIGNNKYEAKFKAYRNGVRQAAQIIADNVGIKDFESYLIPNKELKNAFTIISVDNESYNENFYSADIDLKFDIQVLNKLFIKYGPLEQSERFYEYMVIPVIKKKNNLVVSQPGIEIFDYWNKNREELDNYRLLYPKDLSWLKNINNYKNFSKINFNEIYNSSPKKAYKEILFVIIEQFNSSSQSKNPYIVVSNISVSPEKKNEISTYEIEIEGSSSDKDGLKSCIYQIIHATINAYGNLKTNIIENDLENQIKSNEEQKVYVFNFESYDDRQLQIIQKILEKLGKVDVVRNTDILYNIKITTNLNEEEITEELYENGFSYKIREDGYFLMQEKKGA
jgi:hypothetical protein